MRCPSCNSEGFYIYKEIIHVHRIPFTKNGTPRKQLSHTMSLSEDVKLDYLKCEECGKTYYYDLDENNKVVRFAEF